ncbi:hypothetical protein IVG45_17225 [Methylomonas sp. LL1]|uniref:hypothetical protein n=1 Tax=Methylomonas sp. LL1 TaxID=2785785 RepID=UPI0018C42289|nr:hypothetical protein [Methylomonas sp. LL1]QPK62575.1 hypothetical protein IVG45_17225 [Methylomonas sp. LL1]
MNTYRTSLGMESSSPTLMNVSFTIATRKNSKKGFQEITISLSTNKNSILMETFSLLENTFKAQTPGYTVALNTKNAIHLLQSCNKAIRILSKPACDIKGVEIRQAIYEFEDFLNHAGAPLSKQKIYVCLIRRHIASTKLRLFDGRLANEELRPNKEHAIRPKKYRKIGTVLGNISTIEHIDIKELEHQAKTKINSELQLIENACKNIIDDYIKVVNEHKALNDYEIHPEVKKYYNSRIVLNDPWNNNYFNQPKNATELSLLAFIIQSASSEILNSKIKLPGIALLPTFLKERQLWRNPASYYNFFYAQYFLPNHVLISIAVLICMKTAWNPGSVHAIIKSDIEKLSSTRYSLQSVKNKTDDKTPIYEVRKGSEPLLFRAIELLLWHHKQVTNIYNLTEPRLFIGNFNTVFGIFFPLTKNNLLNNIIKPYKLNNFSASDLRVSRAGITMLMSKNIETVRVLLGHNNISITEGYLNDTLFFRLNEARILEFQRRIEATISFISEGDYLVNSRNLNKRHIDTSLIPAEMVGDGTRCHDPFDSPDPNTKKGERCEGMHCHVNGGCKNNVIQVCKIDVELAQKTLSYYRSRWSYLYEKNPKNFIDIHMQKIIFVHVFLAYIKQNRPDFLKKEA